MRSEEIACLMLIGGMVGLALMKLISYFINM
jgi:hypothetical protein